MAGSAIYGTKLVDDPARIAAVAAIGVDETKWLAAKAKAPTRWASAVARHQRPAGRDTVCAVDDSLVTRFSGCSRAGGPRATVTGGPRISSQ